jgi:methylthioribose-1-phosphate isomerase
MRVKGKNYQTIWMEETAEKSIKIIDQRYLPFEFVIEQLSSLEEVCVAIKDMHLRGAPLIGAAAALGLYLESVNQHEQNRKKINLQQAAKKLLVTRPTAINLKYAINRQLECIRHITDPSEIVTLLKSNALSLIEEEKENCRKIGQFGLTVIEALCKSKGKNQINILTHCNAGWLACIDYGTATAPIYFAHDLGIKVHVWVDETRPRNQGARLTAWELGEHGVPHTVITDNAGGHLMQHGLVDLVIVGSDRTTRSGDVANKIGTYLKALAAKDNRVPFYVALPGTSIDWGIRDGINQIPIEERNAEEVKHVEGELKGNIQKVRITPEKSPVSNFGFDVTPAKLITGLITERGICEASEQGLAGLYPENK